MLRLSFCEKHNPRHFCELKELVQLACSDTFLNNMVMYLQLPCWEVHPQQAGILYSFCRIVSCICDLINSREEKAFSPVHLISCFFISFYCTCLAVYLSSAAPYSSHSSAVASVTCTLWSHSYRAPSSTA